MYIYGVISYLINIKQDYLILNILFLNKFISMNKEFE